MEKRTKVVAKALLKSKTALNEMGDLNEIVDVLYELDTVAKRFGGKYARKVLVTTLRMGSAYVNRAKEMGIEVIRNE